MAPSGAQSRAANADAVPHDYPQFPSSTRRCLFAAFMMHVDFLLLHSFSINITTTQHFSENWPVARSRRTLRAWLLLRLLLAGVTCPRRTFHPDLRRWAAVGGLHTAAERLFGGLLHASPPLLAAALIPILTWKPDQALVLGLRKASQLLLAQPCCSSRTLLLAVLKPWPTSYATASTAGHPSSTAGRT